MSGEKAPARWGIPLVQLDLVWTRIEARLAVWVILAEVATLVLWVSIKGLASYFTPEGSAIGLLYRSIVTAVALGLAAHFIARRPGVQGRLTPRLAPIAVTLSAIGGILLGRVWVHAGVGWASNVAGWLLNASVPMLVGGPRGVVTRLTLWVALLGASMAASKGKHINIDVATRYLPPRVVTPVAITGWLAAAAVCFAASYGFTDSIAVTKFRAEAFHTCPKDKTVAAESGLCDTTALSRFGTAVEGMRTDLFLLGRQLVLDLRTLPHVLTGDPYDKYLKASEWNAWVKGGGWEAHFPKEAVASLYVPEDDPNATRMPAVVAPDTGEGRDLLIRDLNFILPFGLFVIGLKLVLRVLRVLSGHVKVDPDSAHDEEGLSHAHDHDREIEESEGVA
jgi:tripartite ATP-independent transporter DctQ subunit